MGIISKLKSVFGRTDGGGDAGTAVAVEREPAPVDEPAASAERAVKGVDPAPEPAATGESANEPAADDGEPVDSIKGIGTAYADRLAAAGVGSVAELAEADAEALADETGLGAGRIGNWIERARARTR